MALTPHNFLQQLFASGIILSSDVKQNEKDISERTLVKIREYANFFCEAVNEHYNIVMQYPPSKVAVACVYAARKCCQLQSLWNFNLEEYTGYK
jgi:hypothetical protein